MKTYLLDMSVSYLTPEFEMKHTVVRQSYLRIPSQVSERFELLVARPSLNAWSINVESNFIDCMVRRQAIALRRNDRFNPTGWSLSVDTRKFADYSLVGIRVLKMMEKELDREGMDEPSTFQFNEQEVWHINYFEGMAILPWGKNFYIRSKDGLEINLFSHRQCGYRLGGKWSDGKDKPFVALHCSFESVKRPNDVYYNADLTVEGDKVLIVYDPLKHTRLGAWLNTLRVNAKDLYDGKNPRNILFGTTEERQAQYDPSKNLLLFQTEELGFGQSAVAVVERSIFDDYSVSIHLDSDAEKFI